MNYYDMYDPYSAPYIDRTLIGMMMICVIVLLVCAIFGLISYILKGIGMYTMAKRQGMDYAWLAFIPFARTYLHGELAGHIRLKNRSIHSPGIWLLALPFIYSAVSSLMSVVLWFIGVGSLTKVFQYAYMPYGGTEIGAGSVLGMIILFMVYAVLSVGYTAVYKSFQVLVNHQILERFTSKNMSIAHAVLCTLVPLYESVCFFVMRGRPFNPGMEPPTPPPFRQSPPSGAYYGTPVPPPEPPVSPAPPFTPEPPASSAPSFTPEPPVSPVPSVTPEPPVSPTPSVTPESSVPPTGGVCYGETSTTFDFGNSGSILQPTDSVNTGNILQPTDPGTTGNILQPTDSGTTGNILQPTDSGITGSILDTPDDDPAKDEDPAKGDITSSVNFTLLDDEQKDL